MIKKLCLLRLSAIGDVCHAAAMVTRIQHHWPHTEITWVIGKVEYQLVKDMPGVNFVIFDKSRKKAAVQSLKSAIGHIEFDALLMMQVALRANLASRVIKAKKRIGFDWARSKELHWLFTNSRIKPRVHSHVLDGFMDFADALGVPGDHHPTWNVPLERINDIWVREKAQLMDKYAIICPAASKESRNWLPDRYAGIANYLADRGLNVILCGGPGAIDRKIAEQILSYSPRIKESLVGKTNLQQMLGLIRHARLVIAPDTGPAHMATMVGTPVNVVFIGSCTNGRLSDLREAAKFVKGKQVAEGVRALAVPGSQEVARQAIDEGLDKIFDEAGFQWREAGCSMCLAMNPDRLDPGQRCASTSNRNFEGRQGKGGRTHLVSPAMAAAAAVRGHFVDVRDWDYAG